MFFFYSGSIDYEHALKFISEVEQNKKSDSCLIIMTSEGGDPDAAYKMARYLQYKYDKYTVLVSGICASAATLFAIGAKEIVFSPIGELGPLDIQIQKEDKIAGQESGLNIIEALFSLEAFARKTFDRILVDIIAKSGGVVSFKTASDISTGMVSALYAPIFSQIDPEEVGSKIRAMRIGEDYAERLDCGNLKSRAINKLCNNYASHSFVIDHVEAETLFKSIRLVDEDEAKVIDKLGRDCIFPCINKVRIETLTAINTVSKNGDENGAKKNNE